MERLDVLMAFSEVSSSFMESSVMMDRRSNFPLHASSEILGYLERMRAELY